MRGNRGQNRWGWVYSTIGVTLILLTFIHVGFLSPVHTATHKVIFGVFAGGASVAFLYGAYWHLQNPLQRDRYWRLNAWVISGTVFIITIGMISLYIGSDFVTETELLESVHLTGTVGLSLGLAFGTLEARILEQERAAAEAETLENERQRLTLLNDLLRHYVLNGTTIILGYTETLKEEVPGDDTDALDVIQERASLMSNVVSHISVLTKTPWERSEVTNADIEAILRNRFAELVDEEATFEAIGDIPEMYANEGYEDGLVLFIEGVLRMLEPDATLTIETIPEPEGVAVTANPAKIPHGLEEELLEPVASEVGLELYLAKSILEPAIDLEFVSNGEDEVVFHLRGDFVTEHE